MQNQKTEPVEYSERELSAAEDKFVELLATTDNQTEAYLVAYEAHGYSKPALRVAACRKASEPHIRAALCRLKANGLTNSGITLEQRIKDEQAFAQRAEDAGNYGAAGGAHDRLNKLLGLYVEKVQDVTKENDPVATLREIATHSPELAASLASHHNIPWKADEGATKH